MISIARLEAGDRAAWEELFAGYHAFYGRPSWPRKNYDEAWSRIEQDDRIHARSARVDGRLVGIVQARLIMNRGWQSLASRSDEDRRRRQGVAD